MVGLVAAVAYLVRSGMADDLDEDLDADVSTKRESLRTLGGLVGTVIGAQLVVAGATGMADEWGISGGFVGFSLVAFGTSLPELVTTFACARRGETGLILGNLFGSNLFNSLAVGGGIGLVGPGLIGDDLLTSWGLVMMLIVCIGAYLLALNGKFIARFDGMVLVSLYIVSMLILGFGSSDDSGESEAQIAATAPPARVRSFAAT
jgi:cation:H+ antiporter